MKCATEDLSQLSVFVCVYGYVWRYMLRGPPVCSGASPSVNGAHLPPRDFIERLSSRAVITSSQLAEAAFIPLSTSRHCACL